MIRTRKKVWKHTSGSCQLFGGGEFPCDDSYEHITSKKRATFRTSTQAHFKMPKEVASLDEVLALDGVKKEQKS